MDNYRRTEQYSSSGRLQVAEILHAQVCVLSGHVPRAILFPAKPMFSRLLLSAPAKPVLRRVLLLA